MDIPRRLSVQLPAYTLGEELFNAISHGLGAVLSIPAIALMAVKAHGPKEAICAAVFGSAMLLLYTVSCVYHALPARLEGKKVLRVLDHCNVFLLVCGTYIPAALLGVGGALGWVLFGVVMAAMLTGIVFTALDVDRSGLPGVLCHLLSGWSILLGIPALRETAGDAGVYWMLLGGVFYSLGALLYGIGKRKTYMHCVFHVFCLAGTVCHFWAIYAYLL